MPWKTVCHNVVLVFYPRNKVAGYFYTIPFVNKLKADPGVKHCQSYREFCAGGHGGLCWLKRTSGHRNAGGRSCWSSQRVLECSRASDHGQGAHSICSVFTPNSWNGSEGEEFISLFFCYDTFFMILLKGPIKVEYFIIIIFYFWNMSKFPFFRLRIIHFQVCLLGLSSVSVLCTQHFDEWHFRGTTMPSFIPMSFELNCVIYGSFIVCTLF